MKVVAGGGIWRVGVGMACEIADFVGEVGLHNGKSRKLMSWMIVVELGLGALRMRLPRYIVAGLRYLTVG